MTQSFFYAIKPEHLYLSPSPALNVLMEKKQQEKGDMMGKEIHLDTFFLIIHFICSAEMLAWSFWMCLDRSGR